MNNSLFKLPDDFGIGSHDSLIYFYSNDKSSTKNKVVFTKNMFCLLQQGLKEVQTATGKQKVTDQELLMMTSGSVLMSESLAEQNTYEAILVFFGNDTLADFCNAHQLTIAKKESNTPVLKVQRDEFLNHYCQSLQLLRRQNNTAMNELKVQELLGYISSTYPEVFQQLVSNALAGKTDIKLKQVVELNLDKGLTVEELAFLCDMSLSTFKRHFVSQYNMPPQKYFIQVKMEKAKKSLALQKHPSEIYSELGYENLSAFSHEFKKYFGVSPKQFHVK